MSDSASATFGVFVLPILKGDSASQASGNGSFNVLGLVITLIFGREDTEWQLLPR